MKPPEEAFPLCWPAGKPRKKSPRRSQFHDVSFARARDTMVGEVEKLGGKKLIVSTNIPLKLDGMPYGNRNPPADKGVAVYFFLNDRPMVFAFDEFDRIEHNVWAIAKTIEALRGIKRWGSGEMMERAFTGFTALPSPETKKHWREVLGFMNQPSAGAIKILLKSRRDELAKSHHPDLGGSTERMAEINLAFKEAEKELFGK